MSRALDAEAVRPLMAGWRAYRLDEPITLAGARGRLDGVDAADAVQLDVTMHPAAITNDPRVGEQWPLPKIAAPAGWVRSAGAAPVTVAVIDSGVDVSHEDLAGRVWSNPDETANGIDDDGNGLIDDLTGWDFANGNASVYDNPTVDKHGTHVAGTIAARRNNSLGVAGVADNARIMPLKFLGSGGGTTSNAIAAIHYAVAKGARIINASFGSTTYSPALCDAIAEAGAQKVLVVAAAGNDGANNDQVPFWPANCPATTLVSVAATTSSDGLASFSNRGATQVDVGAPGGDGNPVDAGDVLSLFPAGQYGLLPGTSMAAPHVSAAAASALGIRPDLVPWQLITAIVEGGDPVASLATATSTGRRLNLDGALRVAAGGVPDITAPTAPAPVAPTDGLATALAQPAFSWSAAGDSQSGLAGYRLRVDGATVATVGAGTTSAIPGAALGDGRHAWDLVAVDGFGNEAVSAARTLVVDRTAPSAPVPLTPPAGAGRTVGPVSFTWRPATDGLSGLAGYRIDVDGVVAASVGPTMTGARVRLTAGRHSWRVMALDAVGNAAPGPARWVVLRPAPRVTLSTSAIVHPGTRPVLRVRLSRTARVVFQVRPVSGTGVSSRFVTRLGSGRSAVRLPAAVARRLRPGVAYRVSAQPIGGARRSTRINVASLER